MQRISIALPTLAGPLGFGLFLACGGVQAGPPKPAPSVPLEAASRPKVGGACTYQSFPGTATCTRIDPVAGGVRVLFSFQPTDPNAPAQYRFQSQDGALQLQVAGQSQITAEWLTAHKIAVGTALDCIRKEIRTGTCTPLIFTLMELPGATLVRS